MKKDVAGIILEKFDADTVESMARDALEALAEVGGEASPQGVTAPQTATQGFYAGQAVAYDYVLYRMGRESVIGMDHKESDTRMLEYL